MPLLSQDLAFQGKPRRAQGAMVSDLSGWRCPAGLLGISRHTWLRRLEGVFGRPQARFHLIASQAFSIIAMLRQLHGSVASVDFRFRPYFT